MSDMDGTRINGVDGKTIDRVVFNSLMDCTAIYFTDGTNVSFNSEDGEWEVQTE